jgi:hypothetical protein
MSLGPTEERTPREFLQDLILVLIPVLAPLIWHWILKDGPMPEPDPDLNDDDDEGA